MDDVTFSRNGRDAERWRLHRVATAISSVAIPGKSLMSMNACYFVNFQTITNCQLSELYVVLFTF